MENVVLLSLDVSGTILTYTVSYQEALLISSTNHNNAYSSFMELSTITDDYNYEQVQKAQRLNEEHLTFHTAKQQEYEANATTNDQVWLNKYRELNNNTKTNGIIGLVKIRQMEGRLGGSERRYEAPGSCYDYASTTRRGGRYAPFSYTPSPSRGHDYTAPRRRGTRGGPRGGTRGGTRRGPR